MCMHMTLSEALLHSSIDFSVNETVHCIFTYILYEYDLSTISIQIYFVLIRICMN